MNRHVLNFSVMLAFTSLLFLLDWLIPGFGYYWRWLAEISRLLIPVLVGISIGFAVVTSHAKEYWYRMSLAYIFLLSIAVWWPQPLPAVFISWIEQYVPWISSTIIAYPSVLVLIIFAVSIPLGYFGTRLMQWYRK